MCKHAPRLSARFAILFAFLSAAPAQTGTLTSATWVTDVTTIADGQVVTFAVPVNGTGTSTATSVSVSLTVPAFSNTVFVPGDAIDYTVNLMLSGAQLLTATPSMAAATKGVPGSQITKGGATTPFTTLLKVPLTVGKAGTYTGFFYLFNNVHYITADFYGWTPHTKTFKGLTTKLSPLPDVIAKGSFNLNGNGAGTITLVSPSLITVVGELVHKRSVTLTTLKLTFAPEPGTLLLLGAGGLTLIGAGRARRADYGNTT